MQRSFMATVFRGHLEQGGQPIAGLNPARVEITRVVHARQFNPKAAKPQRLEYVLFGKGSELFLAHAIFAPPDFDQVFAVTALGRSFTEAELNRSLRVVFPDRRNVAPDRLRERQKVSGMLMAAGEAKAGTPIQLQTNAEFYFEEGELLVPATFGPTPEESKNKR
jgi:hypothetical protein